jgi:membrane protein DedA with SNARE-associated domain
MKKTAIALYLEHYGYWAVFVAVGVEGMGISAPGQTLLEAGALVAAVPDGKVNIFPLPFALMILIKRRGRS